MRTDKSLPLPSDPEIHQLIQQYADVTGVPVILVIRQAIREWMEFCGEPTMQAIERRTSKQRTSKPKTKAKDKTFGQLVTMTDEIRARALGVRLDPEVTR